MTKALTRLGKELFDFDRAPTVGEALQFKLIELFTVGYVIFWAWDWGFYIQTIRGVVLPLGLANHIDVSVMFDNGVSLWNGAAMTIGAILGFTRLAPRFGYTVAALGLYLHYSARYCLGEICHAPHFVGVTMLALAASMYFSKNPVERRRFAIGGTLFFIGFGYVNAAVCKLIATGITWAHGRHLWLWLGEKTVDSYSKFGVLDHNLFQELILASMPVATLVLASGIIIEATGFLLWFRRTRAVMGLLCIGMHFGIYFSMNIMFDMFIYQLLLLTLPFAQLVDWAMPKLKPQSAKVLTRLSESAA